MSRLALMLGALVLSVSPTFALSAASQALADKYGENWGDQFSEWQETFNVPTSDDTIVPDVAEEPITGPVEPATELSAEEINTMLAEAIADAEAAEDRVAAWCAEHTEEVNVC